MRVVFDSNVWIAALIAAGPSKEVVQEALAVCEVFSSPYILKEIDRFLEKKAGAVPKERRRVHDWIQSVTLVVDPPEIEDVSCPDPKDIPILWLALAVHADLFVTGDRVLQNLKEMRGIKIIPPVLFWSHLK